MRPVLVATLLTTSTLSLGLPGPLLSQGLPTATPESVGLSPTRLQRIGVMVQRYVDEQKLAGAVVLLARGGRVAYFESFGVMDLTTKAPMRRDAIFRIASMTKPIVSVAAMILHEEGKLQLYDPVSRFVPELKELRVYRDGGPEAWTAPKREVTIHDLLRHTSGLVYGEFSSLKEMYDEAHIADSDTLKDMVRRLREVPLLFSPGEGWAYGRSTDVLGYVLEVVSGKPIDAFLRERILDPLQMVDTDFFVPPSKHQRFTSLHALSDQGGLVVTDAPPACKWCQRPSLLEPGGGMVSTASDYVRFSQFLLNGGELDGVRLLSPKTVELMTLNHVPKQAMPLSYGEPAYDWQLLGCGFGLGFRVLLDPAAAAWAASPNSFGWFGYHDTFFVIDPKEELIGIFLAQFTPEPPYPGVRAFQNLMFQAVVQ